MNVLSFLPILIILFYLGILFGILYLINSWVNKFINIRKEQNDLLREVIEKMEVHKGGTSDKNS